MIMKKLSITLVFFLITFLSFGQLGPNLVVNPDLEDGSSNPAPAPTLRGQISMATGWTDDCTDPLMFTTFGAGVDLVDALSTNPDVQVPANAWGTLDERTGDRRYAHLWQSQNAGPSNNTLAGERLKGTLTSALQEGTYDLCFWGARATTSILSISDPYQIVEVFLVNGNDCQDQGLLIYTTPNMTLNNGNPHWNQYCATFNISAAQANTYDRILFQIKDPGTALMIHSQSVYIDEVELKRHICDQTLDLGEDVTICEGDSYTIDITGQVQNITHVAWFKNGNGIAAPPLMQSLVVFSPGTYTVVVSYGDGCTVSSSIIIRVEECGCNIPVEIQAEPDGCNMYFSSQLGGGSSSNVVGYLWDFGDGTTSTEPQPVHFYTTAGTFQVNLFIYYIDQNGDCCVIHETTSVEVTAECAPFCGLSPSFTSVEVAPGVWSFSSTSTSNGFTTIVGYEWKVNGFVVSNDEFYAGSFNGGQVCLTIYGITASGECCSETACADFVQTGKGKKAGGVDPEISIFPNPTHDQLTIELGSVTSEEPVELSISNGVGAEVYYQGSIGSKHEITGLNEWGAGVYFCKVIIGERTYTKKIMVK